MQNALSVNHVLKVEVNEEDRDRAAANNAFEFVPVNEAPASPPPPPSSAPSGTSPALSELPEERPSAEHTTGSKSSIRMPKVRDHGESRPSLMIIASGTQFQVERPWGQRPFSIVS